MSKLNNIRMGFGGEASPTPVTKTQVLAILRALADDSLESRQFGGHISMAADSINRAQEYRLGLAGITYHGATTAVSYTMSASRTSVREGETVTFTPSSTEELPLSAFDFNVKSVSVTSGSITAAEVKALCSFDGTVLTVADSGRNIRWTASIVIEHYLAFDTNNRKEITLTCTGSVKATDFSVSGASSLDIINGTAVTKDYTIAWVPVDCDTPTGIQVTCDNPNISINNVRAGGFSVTFNGFVSYNTVIRVSAIGMEKEIAVSVTCKKVPDITIVGVSSFTAPNGIGQAEYQFAYNPSGYDVPVELMSVVTDNADVTVSESSMAGFMLVSSGLTASADVTVTATFSVDGQTKTYTKTVAVNYVNATIDVQEKAMVESVDLGLPSGLKWANMNVGASAPEQSGLYFQWGSVNGHADDEGYNFTSDNYPESAIFADLTLEQDAARANLGGEWRMPTREELQELYANTNRQWTSLGGVNGYKFIHRSDASKWIFLPASGYPGSDSVFDRGTAGYYWSSSYNSISLAYYMKFQSSSVSPQNSFYRFYGYCVRAVNPNLIFAGSFPKTYKVTTTNLARPTITAAFRNPSANYTVTINGMEVRVDCRDMSIIEENTLLITATSEEGVALTSEVFISNKIVPDVTLEGEAEFVANNGTGSADYTFGYAPADYNVAVLLSSVTSSNSKFTISGQSPAGFRVSVEGIYEDETTTFTAKLVIEGRTVTLTKNVTAKYEDFYELEAVDLGLPSGVKWANMNVGATKPWDTGLFFQWGSVNGHTRNEGYSFAYANYPESTINASLTLEQDAARANLGGEWRMPVRSECKELFDNTTWTWTTQGGVNGYLVTSKINGKSIFLPGGYIENSSFSTNGRYHSATIAYNGSYGLYFTPTSTRAENVNSRYAGCLVRAVL